MSFHWHNYLEFAEAIMATASDFVDPEAVYRSVASRAYYAVYCSARNLVKQKDKKEFFGNAHQELQDYLIGHTHQARSRLGRRLRDLHQLRKKADYDNTLNQPAVRLATHAVKSAKNIEADLEEIAGKKRK